MMVVMHAGCHHACRGDVIVLAGYVWGVGGSLGWGLGLAARADKGGELGGDFGGKIHALGVEPLVAAVTGNHDRVWVAGPPTVAVQVQRRGHCAGRERIMLAAKEDVLPLNVWVGDSTLSQPRHVLVVVVQRQDKTLPVNNMPWDLVKVVGRKHLGCTVVEPLPVLCVLRPVVPLHLHHHTPVAIRVNRNNLCNVSSVSTFCHRSHHSHVSQACLRR